LALETGPKVLVEEAYHFIVFRRSNMRSSIRKKFMKALKQRRLEAKERKCVVQAFGNNSAIGERGLAAEPDVMCKKHNGMQKPVTECTFDSVYFKTCLGSEINLMSLVEANRKAFITSSESSINYSSSIHYWNRSSGANYRHRHSNDHQVMESMFGDGGKLHFYRAENFDSGFGAKQLKFLFLSIGLSKDSSQKLEHQFSTGWLIYTKRAIFGISGSCVSEFNLMSLEPYPAGSSQIQQVHHRASARTC
jgi:hypothetical protein